MFLKKILQLKQDKIINLDKQCENIIKEYNSMLSNYEKAEKQFEVIMKNSAKLTAEEKQKYSTQIDNIVKVLDGYERKLNAYVLNSFDAKTE